jgi:putative component of toxin-antitoxin plasmid stabilization module
MNRFALEDIKEVKGQIRFRKLIVDGVCAYDDFCKQIRQEGNLQKQLIGIVNNMNQVANLKRLPKEKFRDITPSKDPVKEFEIKKGDLRFYVIKEDGHVVVLAGKKSTQHDDINQFRSIKRRYLESKK